MYLLLCSRIFAEIKITLFGRLECCFISVIKTPDLKKMMEYQEILIRAGENLA